MPLYIGIDGGGTKTTCAVGDDATTLAVVGGPGSNVTRVGEERAGAALREVIARACRESGISPLRVQTACIGAAGAANPEVSLTLKKVASRALPNADVNVVGDMVIAHSAALNGHAGVVTIAGTGSIAYGQNEAGHTARAGGWGSQISDEGSGHWIGRAAVSEGFHALDTGQDTVLLERILRGWKLSSRDDLVRHANAIPAPDFAELFPTIQEAADERDPVALAVIAAAGAELGMLTGIVLQRLWTRGAVVRVGIVGGVFANSAQIRRAFASAVPSAWPSAAISFRVADPVVGALAMARGAASRAGVPGVR